MTTFRSVIVTGLTVAFCVVAPPSTASAQGGMQLAIQMYEKSRAESKVDRASVIVEFYKKNPEQRPVVVVVDDNDDGGRGRGRGRGRGGGNMPPGWEKKLAKHGELPSDLRTRVVVMPVALVRSLPALPRGQEYAIVGNRVVVIERSSFLVLDILITL
jgi:hypothetical protein